MLPPTTPCQGEIEKERGQPCPHNHSCPMLRGFRILIPEGYLRIAQRFNVGTTVAQAQVPKGRHARSFRAPHPLVMMPCVLLLLLLAAGLGMAQRFRGGWGGESWRPEYETCRTAREIESHSTGTPNWTNEPGFEKDVFSFVRIRRGRLPYGVGSRRAGHWWTDFPDSDLNLSFRVQQMTSIKVDPEGKVLNLTD